MANEFDNTDPLQLTTEPIQADIPQLQQPTASQPQQPQAAPIQQPLTPEQQREQDFKLFDLYKEQGVDPKDAVGFMTLDGKRSREDVIASMQSQYEIQQREIRAENERMKKEQNAAEVHMIERQQALQEMLEQNKADAPTPTANRDLADPRRQTRDGYASSDIDPILGDTYNIPEGYDSPELVDMYRENSTLAANGTDMFMANNAMGYLKDGEFDRVEKVLEQLGFESDSAAFIVGDIYASKEEIDNFDLIKKMKEGDPEAIAKVNKFLYDKYNSSKTASSQNMRSLASLNEAAGIPWNYNDGSEIDMQQAILDAFKIEANGEKSTQAYQDELDAKREALLEYKESADTWGTFITNRSIGASTLVNDILYALPMQVKGLYLDQIGEDEKAQEQFRAAKLVYDYNETIRAERRKGYGFSEDEARMGITEAIMSDDVSWGTVGLKALEVMEDVLPDVVIAAATLGQGTIIKEAGKQAIKQGAKGAMAEYVIGTALSEGTLAFFGVRGAGSTYASVFEDNTRSKSEKLFLASSVGVAEAVLGKMFKGAEVAIADGAQVIAKRGFTKEALKLSMKGMRKRDILAQGAKQAGGEWLEEAGIEAIDQGVRVIQDKIAGRPTAGIDYNAIMDAGLAGLLGTGPLTSLTASRTAMAHHSLKKNRAKIVSELNNIDKAISLTNNPERIASLKEQRNKVQGFLNQLEGLSEKEYSRLSDSEKRQINSLHREMANTRQEIKEEKDSEVKAALEERYEMLYAEKVKIEKAAEGNPVGEVTPPLADSEGDMTASETRTVDKKEQDEVEAMPEQEADDDIEITEEADARINAKVDSAVRAIERVESDPESSKKHATTAKSMRTRARNLLMAEGMSKADAEAEIDKRMKDKGAKRKKASESKKAKKSKAEAREAKPSKGSVNVDPSKRIDLKSDWIGNGEGQIPLTVVAQIERMKKAFGAVLNKMGVKIQIHLTQDSFQDATGKDSIGLYDINTKTIHIGPKASKADIMEEFGHAAFRTILRSDKALASRLYSSMANEAGIGLNRDGTIALPEGFIERITSEGKIPLTKEDLSIVQLGRTNPFARALIGTEIDYADYPPSKRKEEALMEALRNYAQNPSAFNTASRNNKSVSRLDLLKAMVNRALVRAGYKGNFMDGAEVDFFSFAQKFSLAAEGIETDVVAESQDYTAQPSKENTPRATTKRRSKGRIEARPGETNKQAAERFKREQRERAEKSAIESFENELGERDDVFESRNKRFNFLEDTDIFYYEDRYSQVGAEGELRSDVRARRGGLKKLRVKDYFHYRNWYNYMTSNGIRSGRIQDMFYVKDGVRKKLNPPKQRVDKDGNPIRIDGAMHPDRMEVRSIIKSQKSAVQRRVERADKINAIDAKIKASPFRGKLYARGFMPVDIIGGEGDGLSHQEVMDILDLAEENADALLESNLTAEDVDQERAKARPNFDRFTKILHQDVPDQSPGDSTGEGVFEARPGGFFDALDTNIAASRGLAVGDISEVNGSLMRTFGFDSSFDQRVDINPEEDGDSVDVRSGASELFGKTIKVGEEDRRVISTHRDARKLQTEVNNLRELADRDRRSRNPKGYVTVGFTILKDKTLLGNPSVFSYIVKKFRSDKGSDASLIKSVQAAFNNLPQARVSSVMSTLTRAAFKPGVSTDIQNAFLGDKITIETAEQAQFALDVLSDVTTDASFEFRTEVAVALGADVTQISNQFKDPLFKNADLGTVVSYVKVPYTYTGSGGRDGIRGFAGTLAEGEAFEGAIVLDSNLNNRFEGHRLADKQYRMEDVMPKEKVNVKLREGERSLPKTMGRASRAQETLDRLDKKFEELKAEGKRPSKRDVDRRKSLLNEVKGIRGAVNRLAGISQLPSGVVNLNYGEKAVDNRDIYMGAKRPMSRSVVEQSQESDVLESRSSRASDALFESRQTAEPGAPRPVGQFSLRNQTAFDRWRNKWIQRLQDKYKSVMMIQEDIESFLGRAVGESQDFKMGEELMYGKGATDLAKLDKKVDELKQAMSDEGVGVGEVTDFIYARHAAERNALILERDGVENGSGMSDADAAAVLDGFGAEKRAKLERIAKKIDAIQQDTRDTMVEFGLESQETIDAWEAMFEHYVPLGGLATDEESSSTTPYATGGAGLQVKGPMTKKAKGRKTLAENIVAQVIAQNAAVKIQARTNEALMNMYNLVKENPNDGLWKITKDAKYGAENVVPIRVNGEQEFIYFTDPSYAQTLKNMNIPKTVWLARVLAPANNWLRRSFTTLNPEFFLSNFSRDIQAALFNAAAESDIEGGQVLGQSIVKDLSKRVPAALKALLAPSFGGSPDPLIDKYFQEFQEDGGQTGWGYQKDLKQIASELENEVDGKTGARKILGDTIEKTTGFVEGINDAFENSIRLSAYISARENGVSRGKAAQFAKNITVNFNKNGEYGQIANQIFLFFNASVQGTARLGRSLVSLKPPKAPDGSSREWYERINGAQKMAAGYTVFSAMLAGLGRAISDEDEDGVLFWDKIPDYVKERNLVVMYDGKNYIKIPMPYGFNVFANMGTAMVDFSAGAKDWDESSWFLANSFLSSFSPISFGQSKDIYTYAGKAVTPTAFKPVVDILSNETYFGGQVYAEQSPYGAPKPESSMSFRSPDSIQQFFSLMNEMTGGSVEAPGKVDINPDKFWHVFDYFMGGAGQFVERSGETAFRVGQKVLVDPEIKVEFNDFPMLRKMYGEPSKYYDFEKFKERETEIKQLMREYKDPSARKDNPDRYKGIGSIDKAINFANKKLKQIRKLKRQAKTIDNFAERQVEIQRLMDLERKAIMTFNKYYDGLREN